VQRAPEIDIRSNHRARKSKTIDEDKRWQWVYIAYLHTYVTWQPWKTLLTPPSNCRAIYYVLLGLLFAAALPEKYIKKM